MSNKHHSKGQNDGAKGRYRPPHDRGILGEILFGYSKKESQDRSEYKAGCRNARKQR